MMRKKLFFILALLLVAATGAMAQTTYNVGVKQGTDDANKWTAAPTPAEAGQTVTVNYTGSKIVKSVKASKKAPVPAPTINLSNVIEYTTVTAQNGAVLKGTLGNYRKIEIEDGATVTLAGVTINEDGTSNSTTPWAGITCKGNATIILYDENTVKSYNNPYPGIYVPAEKTLTIKGIGSLNVTGGVSGAGIGGGEGIPCGNIEILDGDITATGGNSGGAGIGSGHGSSCGSITISGGTVTANGGYLAAGIGSGGYGSSCGNITINGGEVTANYTDNNGYTAAAIGSGGIGTGTPPNGDPCSCGDITIANTVTIVTAKSKYMSADNIGAGYGSTCGTVKVGGTEGAIRSNQDTYFYYGTNPQLPESNVTMTPTDNPNEWTLTISDSDVELKIAYFNATAPTAATTGDINAGDATPLVTEGTTTGCTIKYAVTTTNVRPTSTEGFITTVPTAADVNVNKAGTYYVWYYVTATNPNSESQILGPLSVAVLIDKSALITAINEAETYYDDIKNSYSDIAATLKAVIDAAKGVRDNADATLTEISTATTNVNDAVNTATADVAQAKTYTITLADDIVEADKWTFSTTSATAGTNVTVNYNGSKKLKSESVKAKKLPAPVPIGKTIDLSTVTKNEVLENGDILTGELNGNYKISIAQGATVTFAGVTINCVNNSSYQWAGITCLGNATIILKDDSENLVEGFYYYGDFPGIQAGPSGTKLIIKGETKGNGKLTAQNRGSGAGIGGSVGISCGDIEIKGGDITAYGCGNAAGIGSGKGSSCGNITISGGTITAMSASYFNGYNSGNYGAGIGSGGVGGSCGDITISGGTVNAKGGNYGAGIGSGGAESNISAYSSCGDITISGGKVTAEGGTNQGAGIGSGWRSSCDDITISGGEVTATGGKTAAGIGSAGGGKFGRPNPAGSCGNITINGGTVTATGGGLGGTESSPGGKGGSGIGGGYVGKCGDIIITTGVTRVKATKGANAPKSIGKGDNGSCGTVTIFGTSYSDGIVDDYDQNGEGTGSGSQAQEGDYVTLTPTSNPNEWTMTMPASNVEVEADCWPDAVLGVNDEAPTAGTDPIYMGTPSPLVNAGTIGDGSTATGFMYAVTTTETKPELSAFSADVPTAENYDDDEGNVDVYVWYYLVGDDEHSNSEIFATPINTTILFNKFDITFNAANANKIDATDTSKGTVTVKVGTDDPTDKTGDIANDQLKKVKMGSTVTLTAKKGYKFRKVEAKKKD